jgi:hypothetical protein
MPDRTAHDPFAPHEPELSDAASEVFGQFGSPPEQGGSEGSVPEDPETGASELRSYIPHPDDVDELATQLDAGLSKGGDDA